MQFCTWGAVGATIFQLVFAMRSALENLLELRHAGDPHGYSTPITPREDSESGGESTPCGGLASTTRIRCAPKRASSDVQPAEEGSGIGYARPLPEEIVKHPDAVR